MNQESMNGLVELIRRSISASALDVPGHQALVDWLKASGQADYFYQQELIEKRIDALRNSQYSTMFEKRSLVQDVLNCIVTDIIEEMSLDIAYCIGDRRLHVGIVVRDTFNGLEAVIGIRNVSETVDPTWEYLPVRSPRLFDAIAARCTPYGHTHKSPYGVSDPIFIGEPCDFS